jgi:hypothetical protein
MGTPSQPMRVIGAGFGRTGTSSLKRALERLGFGPCHHMEEVVKHPGELSTWVRAGRGEPIDWKAFMSPWGSSCDFPSSLYYRELMEAFPDAKVVLTVRDPGAWYTSMSETIVPMMRSFPNRLVMPHVPILAAPFRSMEGTHIRREIIDRFGDREHVIRVFEQHIAEVKRTVPAERLLVFEVKEGWAPLCEFLGVPVPSEPFPRVNDTAAFKRRTVVAQAISWLVLLLPIALLLALLRWILF